MPSTRREFLHQMKDISLGATALSLLDPIFIREAQALSRQRPTLSPFSLAMDEDHWRQVRKKYDLSKSYISLESGYYSPAARPVLKAQLRHIKRVNRLASFFMVKEKQKQQEETRKELAFFLGCDPDELALVRNTTEALDTVIHGLELNGDDEVLFSEHEYGYMIQAWTQRAKRTGLNIKTIKYEDFPYKPKTDEEVVRAFENAITDRTRIIMVSYMTFRSGQILPIRKICEMAHRRGIEVMVDGAHAPGQLAFEIQSLGCDYFGASLHKWLGSPLGAGVLVVKKDKIPKVWPLFCDSWTGGNEDNITKFEQFGTFPVASHLSIRDAILFQKAVGTKNKEERLRHLKNYWAKQVDGYNDRVRINTPLGEHQSCAIASFEIEGKDSKEVNDELFQKYGIYASANRAGVRVVPNVWTKLSDLDHLIKAIENIATS